MIGRSDGFEVDPFGANLLLEVDHLQVGDPVTPRNELAAERGERMNVAGNRRADDPEMRHPAREPRERHA